MCHLVSSSVIGFSLVFSVDILEPFFVFAGSVEPSRVLSLFVFVCCGSGVIGFPPCLRVSVRRKLPELHKAQVGI